MMAFFLWVRTCDMKFTLSSLNGFSKHAGRRMLTSTMPSTEPKFLSGVFMAHPLPAFLCLFYHGFGRQYFLFVGPFLYRFF
jgi:hypothetical protein